MQDSPAASAGTRYRRQVTDPGIYYTAALLLLCVITVVHTLSLPVVVNDNSGENVHLSYIAMIPVLAGFSGLLLTGSTIRTVAGNTAGAITLLMLTFYPVLVCYEHVLSPETGRFFLLALLVRLLVKRRTPVLSVLLMCVIAFGYYWQPAILVNRCLPADRSETILTGPLKRAAAYPGQYISGVGYRFIYFLNVPRHRPNDETRQFSRAVFQPDSPKQFEPKTYKGSALIGRLFSALNALYDWFILCSSILSVWWLLDSLWERNAVGMMLSGVPLAFLFLHALTMTTAARYAFPVYPLIMANCVTVISLAARGWRNKRAPETL